MFMFILLLGQGKTVFRVTTKKVTHRFASVNSETFLRGLGEGNCQVKLQLQNTELRIEKQYVSPWLQIHHCLECIQIMEDAWVHSPISCLRKKGDCWNWPRCKTGGQVGFLQHKTHKWDHYLGLIMYKRRIWAIKKTWFKTWWKNLWT